MNIVQYYYIKLHTEAPFRSSSLLNARPTSLAAPVTITRLSLICIILPIFQQTISFVYISLLIKVLKHVNIWISIREIYIFIIKQLTAWNHNVSLSMRPPAVTQVFNQFESLLEPIWKKSLFSFGDLRPRDLHDVQFVRVSLRVRFVIHETALWISSSPHCIISVVLSSVAFEKIRNIQWSEITS